jgi:hypothetical protein
MKLPSLLEGVLLALFDSVAAGALFDGLSWIWPVWLALRVVITGLGLAYCIYLLMRARQRAGRLTALLAWLGVDGLLWLWFPPLPVFLLAQVAMIWLLRSLYFHQNLFASLADLALSGFSLTLSIWASARSGSLWLSVWCFFLCQALFVLLPKRRAVSNRAEPPPTEDRFQRAHRSAEAALRKLASHS